MKTLFKKGASPKLTLPKCGQVSNVPPCTKQAKVLPNGDLRVKVLINSDPKLATRARPFAGAPRARPIGTTKPRPRAH